MYKNGLRKGPRPKLKAVDPQFMKTSGLVLLTLDLDDRPVSEEASALALLNQLAAASAFDIEDGAGDLAVLGWLGLVLEELGAVKGSGLELDGCEIKQHSICYLTIWYSNVKMEKENNCDVIKQNELELANIGF